MTLENDMIAVYSLFPEKPGNPDKKKRLNIPISFKVFIFAAGVTPYTIIKKTFR